MVSRVSGPGRRWLFAAPLLILVGCACGSAALGVASSGSGRELSVTPRPAVWLQAKAWLAKTAAFTEPCWVVSKSSPTAALPVPFQVCVNSDGGGRGSVFYSVDRSGGREGLVLRVGRVERTYGGAGDSCNHSLGSGWYAYIDPDPATFPWPSCPAGYTFKGGG